jgi:hypothetical protein
MRPNLTPEKISSESLENQLMKKEIMAINKKKETSNEKMPTTCESFSIRGVSVFRFSSVFGFWAFGFFFSFGSLGTLTGSS